MENPIQLHHREVLATRWLSVKQFEEAGISCRRGPFVEREIQDIDEAIKKYQAEHELDEEQLDDLIYSDLTDVTNVGGFWSYVARAVPQRGVKSVFYHVKRARDALGKAGKWNAAEDDQLKRAVETHGTVWVAVADMVQRSPADCRDRYNQHVQYHGTKRTGSWSEEEEAQLLCAIEELAKVGITNTSASGFWVSVSKELHGTRTPKQCRNKWSDTVQPNIGKEGKARWGKIDSYILICKIASLNVDKEADIYWKSLTDASWMWSTRSLQQRWKGLKVSITDNGGMSHRDIVHNLVARTTNWRLKINNSAPLSSTST